MYVHTYVCITLTNTTMTLTSFVTNTGTNESGSIGFVSNSIFGIIGNTNVISLCHNKKIMIRIQNI